jgi:hypothetical protein
VYQDLGGSVVKGDEADAQEQKDIAGTLHERRQVEGNAMKDSAENELPTSSFENQELIAVQASASRHFEICDAAAAAEVSVKQSPCRTGEKTDDESGLRIERDKIGGRQPIADERRDGGKQHQCDSRHGAAADHGVAACPVLTRVSSMVMRRFLLLASRSAASWADDTCP